MEFPLKNFTHPEQHMKSLDISNDDSEYLLILDDKLNFFKLELSDGKCEVVQTKRYTNFKALG